VLFRNVSGELVDGHMHAARTAERFARANMNTLHLFSSMGGSGRCVKDGGKAGPKDRPYVT